MRWPSGVVKPDMFSIAPRSSRSTFPAISAARLATLWAAGCGGVTTRTLAWGSSCGGAGGGALGRRLRGRHDQDLGLGKQLREGHRDVSGPRREVEQEVVEVAP